MDIQEIRNAKSEFEKETSRAIMNFKTKTGVEIKKIDLGWVRKACLDKISEDCLIEITLEDI